MDTLRVFVKRNRDLIFLTSLFAYLLFVFKTAFSIKFYGDDYFFLQISRAETVQDFINFFNPYKDYFYRSLSTEVYYFVIHLFGENTIIGHIITFLSFFVSVYFLLKISLLLSKNRLFSYLFVMLYAVSFTHVYQLYVFNTFQEVALLMFLTLSFYQLILKNKLLSILFFVLALLSKETAIVYPIFLGVFYFWRGERNVRKIFTSILAFILISALFILLYKNGIASNTQLESYSIGWHPRLVLNNSIWYLLWSWGFPAFLSDYLPSFTAPPIPSFWTNFKDLNFFFYFVSLLIYVGGLIGVAISTVLKDKKRIQILSFVLFTLISFFIFILAFTPILHKWMVRLTVPLVFIALLQAAIIHRFLELNKNFKYIAYSLLILFLVWNYFGTKVHETASTYLLETKIYNNAETYFKENKMEILKHDVIYFDDTTFDQPKGWNGSEKLKTSLGSRFPDHFFPKKKMKVVYESDTKQVPKNAYIIESNALLR